MIIFGPINRAVFDWPWSGIHFLSGVCIGALLALLGRGRKILAVVGIGLLIIWEAIERTLHFLDVYHHAFIAPLKNAVDGFAFAAEVPANIAGDIFIGTIGLFVGWFIIKKIRQRA